jgi:hypothetical protein
MVLRGIFIWAAICGWIGLIPPILLWRFYPRYRRRSQRLVDIVSYSITVIALGTGLLSAYRIDSAWRDLVDEMNVDSANIDADFDEVIEIDKLCTPLRHTPFTLGKTRRADCERLQDYLAIRQGSVPGVLSLKIFPPAPSKFNDPVIRSFVEKASLRAYSANVATLKYAGSRRRTPNDLETLYLQLALPLLALALGLGVSRRALDAVQDWLPSAGPASQGRAGMADSLPPAGQVE